MTTESILNIPEDGNRWISDVSVNLDTWIQEVCGDPIDLQFPDDAAPDWDSDDAVLPAIQNHAQGADDAHWMDLESVARDNTYNHESDLDAPFTYSIYCRKGEDWIWSDDVYVAICRHRGGDVRGNYSGPEFYRVDSLADAGFATQMIGWHVTDADGNHIDPDGRYGEGYAANPTCELEGDLDADPDGAFCWKGGAFHARMDGKTVVCWPNLYIG